MSNVKKIAVIGGDGTGPEVTAEAIKVLDAVAKLEGFRFDRTILDYYEDVGKVRALDAMVQAFRSGRVHEDDMDNLAEAASRYAGINPQADQFPRHPVGVAFRIPVRHAEKDNETGTDSCKRFPLDRNRSPRHPLDKRPHRSPPSLYNIEMALI